MGRRGARGRQNAGLNGADPLSRVVPTDVALALEQPPLRSRPVVHDPSELTTDGLALAERGEMGDRAACPGTLSCTGRRPRLYGDVWVLRPGRGPGIDRNPPPP